MPTVYKMPTKTMRPKEASEKDKRLWERHRKANGKAITLPPQKVN